jgi:hypothetical protein
VLLERLAGPQCAALKARPLLSREECCVTDFLMKNVTDFLMKSVTDFLIKKRRRDPEPLGVLGDVSGPAGALLGLLGGYQARGGENGSKRLEHALPGADKPHRTAPGQRAAALQLRPAAAGAPPLLLPLPMSLLYTHSLPPFQVARAVELAETLAAHASFAAACAADAPALSPPLLARVSALLRRRALVLPRSPHSPLSCVHFRRVHLLRPRVPTRYRPIVPPPHALPPRVAPPH